MSKVYALFFLLFLGGAITVQAQSVYLTKTGAKYHKETCYHLKQSKRELNLETARDAEYTPCSHCKSIGYKKSVSRTNTVGKRSVAVQCSGKTKSGSRCKRRTKDPSGRCFQH